MKIGRGAIIDPTGRPSQASVEEKRTMAQRVLSSLVGLPLLVFCVIWHQGLFFALGIAVLSFVAVSEFEAACRRQGLRPVPWLGQLTALFWLFMAYTAGDAGSRRWSDVILTAFLIAGLVEQLARSERAPVKGLGVTLLGALYAGWLFRYLILLRTQGRTLLAVAGGHLAVSMPPLFADPGAWLLLLVVAMTWGCDTAAFFTGRSLGRHKLAPAVSPGKTVEGAIGGLVAALAIAMGMGWLLLRLDPRRAAAMGALVAVAAPVGDLCESAMKRELGIKDFGGFLPGHGGVLDRFDSLLFTAPVIYYLLSLP